MDTLDPTIQGICFLVAIVLATIAAFQVTARIGLFPLAFAIFVFPFMYNAFALA
jgi:hypothetical protein